MNPSVCPAGCFILFLCASGCGSTQQRAGTDQLLLSDSIDRAIDGVDLSVLSGRSVYLDSGYIKTIKGVALDNTYYVISSLRQKLITSGCVIEDTKEDADYIVEARVGALGTDFMEVTYGLPASNGLTQAAALFTGVPAIPAIPEISLGKRNGVMSTCKVMLFAYHRATGAPVWQSGTAIARSDAKDSWIFGAGPFQRGTIYNGVQFAGGRIWQPWLKKKNKASGFVTMADSHQFTDPADLELQIAKSTDAKASDDEESGVIPASYSQPAE